jgi:hypothetical protein
MDAYQRSLEVINASQLPTAPQKRAVTHKLIAETHMAAEAYDKAVEAFSNALNEVTLFFFHYFFF